MNSKIFLAIFSLFLLINCTNSVLEEDKTIQNIFTQDEIKDLAILMVFFENKICEFKQTSSEEVSDCYSNYGLYWKEVIESETTLVTPNISYKEQLLLYKTISSSTFDEVWEIGEGENAEIRYTNGKYLTFLEELSNDNEVVANYYESYLFMETMNPGMYGSLFINHEYFDFGDVRIRLFYAIHFLTLNDYLKRNRPEIQ
ncbi:MAG: hypothetical protein ACPG4Z_04625 [Chitinophagales bacterium]